MLSHLSNCAVSQSDLDLYCSHVAFLIARPMQVFSHGYECDYNVGLLDLLRLNINRNAVSKYLIVTAGTSTRMLPCLSRLGCTPRAAAVLIGGILIHLSIGSIYTFGKMILYLSDIFCSSKMQLSESIFRTHNFEFSLIFTALWSNSAVDKLMIFFLFFPRKQDLTFHTNSLYWRQFA